MAVSHLSLCLKWVYPGRPKRQGSRDPREESLEEAISAYFEGFSLCLGPPCAPGALFIKKSLMKTYYFAFPNHETNETLPYESFKGLMKPLRASESTQESYTTIKGSVLSTLSREAQGVQALEEASI